MTENIDVTTWYKTETRHLQEFYNANKSVDVQQQQQQELKNTPVMGIGVLTHIPSDSIISNFGEYFHKYWLSRIQHLSKVTATGDCCAVFAVQPISKKYLDQITESQLRTRKQEYLSMKAKLEQSLNDIFMPAFVQAQNMLSSLFEAHQMTGLSNEQQLEIFKKLSEQDQSQYMELIKMSGDTAVACKDCETKLEQISGIISVFETVMEETLKDGVYPNSTYGTVQPFILSYLGHVNEDVENMQSFTNCVQNFINSVSKTNNNVTFNAILAKAGRLNYFLSPIEEYHQEKGTLEGRVNDVVRSYFDTRTRNRDEVLQRLQSKANNVKSNEQRDATFSLKDLNGNLVTIKPETVEMNIDSSNKRSRCDDNNVNQCDDVEQIDNDEPLSDENSRNKRASTAYNIAFNMTMNDGYYPPELVTISTLCVPPPLDQNTMGYLYQHEYVLITLIPSHVSKYYVPKQTQSSITKEVPGHATSRELGLIAPLAFSNDKSQLQTLAENMSKDAIFANFEYMILQKGDVKILPRTPYLNSLCNDNGDSIIPHYLNALTNNSK